jgi:hypothetical protein
MGYVSKKIGIFERFSSHPPWLFLTPKYSNKVNKVIESELMSPVV